MTTTIKLTKRQHQILGLVAKGASNAELAAALDISVHTVKVHVWRMFRRLNVKSRTEAVAWLNEREAPDRDASFAAGVAEGRRQIIEAVAKLGEVKP